MTADDKPITRYDCRQCFTRMEIKNLKEDNEKRDSKLDSIHRLAYGIMGGIIISLAIQVINTLAKVK